MRSTAAGGALFLLVAISALAGPAAAQRRRCPLDSVRVGQTCVDKYEASVWSIPADQVELLAGVRAGRVTAAELLAGGAVQLGSFVQAACTGEEYGQGFPVTGNWTAPVYAVSIPGVLPSSCLTWFQAEQACRLSDKRLLTNEEWQAAAAGTPDPGASDDGATTCATTSPAPATTGARSGCVSAWGAHDMVGNVWEWISHWADSAADCVRYDATYGNDISCSGANVVEPTPEAGASARRRARQARGGGADIFPLSRHFPSAVIRGGNFAIGDEGGVFAFYAGAPPFNVSRGTGFRCAR